MSTQPSGCTRLPDLPGGIGRYLDRHRTQRWGQLIPVHGQTSIISLPHACLAAGLLETAGVRQTLSRSSLSMLAQEKWQGSVDRFFNDAARLGVDQRSAGRRARDLGGAIIGWHPAGCQGTPDDEVRLGICSDLNLTVAVLSCCVDYIFISTRVPDFSWAALFGKAFACDDDLGPAPALDQAPWRQYLWGSEPV